MCRFLGTVDDFREGVLFGIQVHGMPLPTYDAFMYMASEEIAKKMKGSYKKYSANICASRTFA
jgi:hypothetical protein